MRRVSYQVKSWKHGDIQGPSIVDWTDNIRQARRQALKRANYTFHPGNCNCDQCLLHKGLEDIEIIRWKVDQQDNTVIPGQDYCVESLHKTNGKWIRNDWTKPARTLLDSIINA